jgi:hypothetical protein
MMSKMVTFALQNKVALFKGVCQEDDSKVQHWQTDPDKKKPEGMIFYFLLLIWWMRRGNTYLFLFRQRNNFFLFFFPLTAC